MEISQEIIERRYGPEDEDSGAQKQEDKEKIPEGEESVAKALE